MKNKYYVRSRISEAKFREIVRYFSYDLDASKIAKLTNISRNSINKIIDKIRKSIFILSAKIEKDKGEFELDESYFGPKRVKGKRGRGAMGKTPVFGLLKRDGKVYIEIVKNCTRKELMPIIQGKILEGSTINTDGWKAYNGLVLNGYKHHRVFHSDDEFVRGKCHINGIESFWSYCKRRLIKFNGIKGDKLIIHLKESEFRFNNIRKDLYCVLLKMLRENPLS